MEIWTLFCIVYVPVFIVVEWILLKRVSQSMPDYDASMGGLITLIVSIKQTKAIFLFLLGALVTMIVSLLLTVVLLFVFGL